MHFRMVGDFQHCSLNIWTRDYHISNIYVVHLHRLYAYLMVRNANERRSFTQNAYQF